jgi:integrase
VTPLPAKIVHGLPRRARKLDNLRRQLDMGIVIGTSRGVTVTQYLEAWVAGTLAEQVAAGTLRTSTRDSYADTVERHITPYVGRHRLEELKPPHLRAWIAEPRKTTSARGRLLSARSIQLAHATLRRAFNDAVRDELIPRNPALLVQPGKVPRSTVQPLTIAEAKALLSAAVADRLYALWLVLMSLGLRRGEALALRWSDFDFEARTVHISRSLQRRCTDEPSTRGRYRYELLEMPPKTEGSIRGLALPPSLLTVLK